MPSKAQGSASVRNSCSMVTASVMMFLDGLLIGRCFEVGEEEAGEVGVHAFVARDELIGKGQARHEPAFLQPENGCE